MLWSASSTPGRVRLRSSSGPSPARQRDRRLRFSAAAATRILQHLGGKDSVTGAGGSGKALQMPAWLQYAGHFETGILLISAHEEPQGDTAPALVAAPAQPGSRDAHCIGHAMSATQEAARVMAQHDPKLHARTSPTPRSARGVPPAQLAHNPTPAPARPAGRTILRGTCRTGRGDRAGMLLVSRYRPQRTDALAQGCQDARVVATLVEQVDSEVAGPSRGPKDPRDSIWSHHRQLIQPR